MRSSEQYGQLGALVLSVAVHCALVAYAAWRPPPPEPKRTVTAEFVFETTQPPPPEPEPTPPPPEPEPPPRAEPPKPPKTVRPPPPPRDVPPPPRDVPTGDVPPRDVPRDVPTADPLPQDVPRALPTLVPGSAFAIRLDAGIEDEVPERRGLQALEAPKDIVGSIAKETLGQGRVDRGLVHPYYSQLGKTLLKNWDADRVAKSGLKGLLEQTQENAKLYNEIWSSRAAEYGRSGNPMGDVNLGTNRRAAVNNNIQGLSGVDLDQRKELQRQLKEAYKATRRAVIRVVQDSQGKLLKVELVQPSNDQKVDKEAMADVRSAAEKLPPPPPEALNGKTTLSSLWSFELVVSISPPVPTFTFEFDEALGFVDMRLPLDRRIYKKVRLVSVE